MSTHERKTSEPEKAASPALEEGQYPELTKGSEIAKAARKAGNKMSEKDVESNFALAMSLMYGGRPQQEPCAGH